jgi:hypothetical protein
MGALITFVVGNDDARAGLAGTLIRAADTAIL